MVNALKRNFSTWYSLNVKSGWMIPSEHTPVCFPHQNLVTYNVTHQKSILDKASARGIMLMDDMSRVRKRRLCDVLRDILRGSIICLQECTEDVLMTFVEESSTELKPSIQYALALKHDAEFGGCGVLITSKRFKIMSHHIIKQEPYYNVKTKLIHNILIGIACVIKDTSKDTNFLVLSVHIRVDTKPQWWHEYFRPIAKAIYKLGFRQAYVCGDFNMPPKQSVQAFNRSYMNAVPLIAYPEGTQKIDQGWIVTLKPKLFAEIYYNMEPPAHGIPQDGVSEAQTTFVTYSRTFSDTQCAH